MFRNGFWTALIFIQLIAGCKTDHGSSSAKDVDQPESATTGAVCTRQDLSASNGRCLGYNGTSIPCEVYGSGGVCDPSVTGDSNTYCCKLTSRPQGGNGGSGGGNTTGGTCFLPSQAPICGRLVSCSDQFYCADEGYAGPYKCEAKADLYRKGCSGPQPCMKCANNGGE